MIHIYTIAAMLPVLIIGDLIWLGVIMTNFYRANLGHLMGDAPAWVAAGCFYVLYICGVYYFAVQPVISGLSGARTFDMHTFAAAALAGALLGIFAYGTYDLTNHATLRDWQLVVTVVDMLWGAFLTSLVTVWGVWVGMRIV